MHEEWQYINPEHQKLFKSMERVWEQLVAKGKTNDDPTYKALSEGKPYDYYWSERFKDWLDWPMRHAVATKRPTPNLKH